MPSRRSDEPSARGWRREARRSWRLAKDLVLRLVIGFGIAIGYGLFELKVRHHGTPESLASTCGLLAITLVIGSLIVKPPAYFNYFSPGDAQDDD